MTEPGELDDRELVERVRAQDAEAFSELVRRYMRRAFSVAYRLLKHREDAEDLVQDAFVIVQQKIHTFDTGRPFAPWFFRILMNRGINAGKARRVRETDPIPVTMETGEASPDAALERGEIRRAFQAAFATLSERQQTIVRLFELEGFSSAEIGRALDLSDGTVRWHLHQARAALREALTPLKEAVDE